MITKNRQTDAAVTEMAKAAFPEKQVVRITELPEGMCNAAYCVAFSDGSESISRPPNSLACLGSITSCCGSAWDTERGRLRCSHARTRGSKPRFCGFCAGVCIAGTPFRMRQSFRRRSRLR